MLTEILKRQTRHGLVLVFELPPVDALIDVRALLDTLLPSERAPLERAVRRRQITYAGGRFAMRRVLEALGFGTDAPILADDRGAPVLPSSVRGSISHKDTLAAALGHIGDGQVGIDVEHVPGPSDELARRILTAAEHAHVSRLAAPERVLELSLRFSAKEAIYKALDPYVRRYVGYQEVEVWPLSNGDADVWSSVFPAGMHCDVTWEKLQGTVLTTARIGP